MKKDVRFTISLTDEQAKNIDAMAEKIKRSRSYAIRRVIDEYFKMNPKWLAFDPGAKKR